MTHINDGHVHQRLLTAVRWLMGAMSTHLANQAKIIDLMSKKDGDG